MLFTQSSCLNVNATTVTSYTSYNTNKTTNLNTTTKHKINITSEGSKIKIEVNANDAVNNVQIWGSSGSNWILVKDYSDNKGLTNKGKYTYTWDLKKIDKNNESYYQPNLTINPGVYKIYVKYKQTEKFKTFYLRNKKINEVNILTSFDYKNLNWNQWINKKSYNWSNIKKADLENFKWNGLNLNIIHNIPTEVLKKSDFPVTAEQYFPFLIFLSIGKDISNYTVKIIGDNGYEVCPFKLCNLNVWFWIPKNTGIFKIIACNSNGSCVERKVYVNSFNNNYLQLKNLKIHETPDNTNIYTKISGEKPYGFDEDENKIMKFIIGEPQVWSKTLKNYGETVRKNENYYEVSEKKDNFKFNKGTYAIGVYLKGNRSIEYEDAKYINYKKYKLNNLKLNLKLNTASQTNQNGEYPVNSNFHFTATIDSITEDSSNLQYAFLLYDARGKKLVQGYSKDNTFDWQPADPGNYIIYTRVKQVSNSNNFPNSYETETAYPVKIYDNQIGNITINQVFIDNHRIDNKSKNKVSINSHEMHYIHINANYKNKINNNRCFKSSKNRLMYKAYAIHDGYCQTVNNYSSLNIIPFYPKSTGTYKIIILVKDSISGSEEAKLESIINIK